MKNQNYLSCSKEVKNSGQSVKTHCTPYIDRVRLDDEREILAAIMGADRKKVFLIVNALSSDDFQHYQHKILFLAIKKVSANELPTSKPVSRYLKRTGGDPRIVWSLCDHVFSQPYQIPRLISKIKENR